MLELVHIVRKPNMLKNSYRESSMPWGWGGNSNVTFGSKILKQECLCSSCKTASSLCVATLAHPACKHARPVCQLEHRLLQQHVTRTVWFPNTSVYMDSLSLWPKKAGPLTGTTWSETVPGLHNLESGPGAWFVQTHCLQEGWGRILFKKKLRKSTRNIARVF